ncbi:MAG: hypothetical protein HC824_15545 [Synechococcales cyanobacterium RM1_1_8]|nr:hypothetical protein [Synechococcales cyanobacterium RM1_1_8]
MQVSDPSKNKISGPNEELLTRDAPPVASESDEESYGLDGYWERRSAAQGVRVIVGQRLELGNAFGWGNVISEDANGNGTLDANEDLNGNGSLDRAISGADLEAANNTGAVLASLKANTGAATRLFDPLYPPPADAAGAGGVAARRTEQRQWKTYRNNLAAAQSTGVYHYLLDGGKYPAACLASTSHPGSQQTIIASTTFDKLSDSDNRPDVNFLNGKGTNGWEFYPPLYGGTGQVTSASLTTAREAFAAELGDGSSPLRIALQNLANFSGDPAGAFPAFQDQVGGVNAANSTLFRTGAQLDSGVGAVTHPYPIHTMWGDFSNLRRALSELDAATGTGAEKYEKLSLADQTTLQTAACTMGMVAYNVGNILNNLAAKETDLVGSEAQRDDLVAAIRALETSGRLKTVTAGGKSFAEIDYRDLDDEDKDGNTNERLTARIEINGENEYFNKANPRGSVPADLLLKALDVDPAKVRGLQALRDKYQIQRDRIQGFSTVGFSEADSTGVNQYGYEVKFQSGRVLGQKFLIGDRVRLQCDFEGNNYFGAEAPRDAKQEYEFLTLALALCPSGPEHGGPKYPSLAYLFPVAEHGHDGTLSARARAEGATEFKQPATEPYTSARLTLQTSGGNDYPFHNRYAFINEGGTTGGINYVSTNDAFKVVGDSDNNGVENVSDSGTGDSGIKAIALAPKLNPADWSLPSTTPPRPTAMSASTRSEARCWPGERAGLLCWTR